MWPVGYYKTIFSFNWWLFQNTQTTERGSETEPRTAHKMGILSNEIMGSANKRLNRVKQRQQSNKWTTERDGGDKDEEEEEEEDYRKMNSMRNAIVIFGMLCCECDYGMYGVRAV